MPNDTVTASHPHLKKKNKKGVGAVEHIMWVGEGGSVVALSLL